MKWRVSTIALLASMIFWNCTKSTKQEPQGGRPAQGPAREALLAAPLKIVAHEIVVRLDPDTHAIEAEDRISLETGGKPENLATFRLNRQLVLDKVLFLEHKPLNPTSARTQEPVALTARRAADAQEQVLDTVAVDLPGPTEKCVLVVSYKGTLYDLPRRDERLRFVVGDRTEGTIGPEGVYLHGGTYWYPTTDDMMATFKVRTTTPKGWEVVGQGGRTERKESEDSLVTEWVCDVPSDSLCLVAGKYVVNEEKRNGVTIATFFFPEEKELAKMYIDTADEYITYYSEMFGPYPFGWFSIVENFFPTGFGMPSYTLLAQEVVKTPARHIGPGGLGHEIVHCWWGNYVVPDWKNGNWCEGLTTYLSNYLWVERKEGAEKAREYRQRQMLRYSVFVNDSNEYPVRKFEGKTEQVDNEIGYGKCSMMFHLLRRMMGDAGFFEALRDVVQRHGGKRTNWSDFQKAFERRFGKNLGWFFAEWLDRKGAPMPAVTAPKVSKAEDGRWQTDFSILMENPEPYHLLNVEVQGVSEGGSSCVLIAVQAAETKVRIVAEKAPTAVTVDPDYHIFRRLRPEEYPSCLNVTISDQKRILIRPSGGEPAEREAYEKLAQRIMQSGGWATMLDSEVTDAELCDCSFLVLGRPAVNSLVSRLAGMEEVKGIVSLEPAAFVFKGNRYEDPKQSLMISFRSPWNKERHVTLFMGVSAEAALMAQRLLFYYGWENWYIFNGERAAERGMHEEPRNALRVEVGK